MESDTQVVIKPGFLDTGSSSEKLVAKSSGKCCKCFLDRTTAQITCDTCLMFICNYCHWCPNSSHEFRKCGICKLGWCGGCCAEMKLCEGCGQWMCADCWITCNVCSKSICGGRAADFGGEICSQRGCSSSGCENNALCTDDARTCFFCARTFCQTCVNICAHCQISVCPKESKYLLQCDSDLEGASCLAFMCFVCILKKELCPACGVKPSKALIISALKGSQKLLSDFDQNGEASPVVSQPVDGLLEPPPVDDDDEDDEDMPYLMEEAGQWSDSDSDVDVPKSAAAKPSLKGTFEETAPKWCVNSGPKTTSPKADAATLPTIIKTVHVMPVRSARKPRRDLAPHTWALEPPSLLSSDDEDESEEDSDSERRSSPFPSHPSCSSMSYLTARARLRLYPDAPPRRR